MLRIRFSRTGKNGQPSFRVVVSEHRSPVKGRYIEMLGHYMPARNPKVISIKKDRVEYWISKGAIPSDSTAALFKKEGYANMEKYLRPRDRKRSTKGEEGKAAAAPAAAQAKTESKPAEEKPAAPSA